MSVSPRVYWSGKKLLKERVVFQTRADFAMFGRPGNPVSKVSYMVPTPSAGRGLCKAIYHNNYYVPVLVKVEVLNPIRTINIGQTMFRDHAISKTGKYGGSGDKALKAPATGVFLQDVEYRWHFDIFAETPKKAASLRKRLAEGAFNCSPYLGVRDCIAEIVPVDNRPPDSSVNLIEAAMFIGMRPEVIIAKNGVVEFPDWTFEAMVDLSDYRANMEGRTQVNPEVDEAQDAAY